MVKQAGLTGSLAGAGEDLFRGATSCKIEETLSIAWRRYSRRDPPRDARDGHPIYPSV